MGAYDASVVQIRRHRISDFRHQTRLFFRCGLSASNDPLLWSLVSIAFLGKRGEGNENVQVQGVVRSRASPDRGGSLSLSFVVHQNFRTLISCQSCRRQVGSPNPEWSMIFLQDL